MKTKRLREEKVMEADDVQLQIMTLFHEAGFGLSMSLPWGQIAENEELQETFKKCAEFDPEEVYKFVEDNVSLGLEAFERDTKRGIPSGDYSTDTMRNVYMKVSKSNIVKAMNWYKETVLQAQEVSLK